MRSKSAFHGALAILVLGTLLGLGYNLFNPNGLPWIAPKRGGITLDQAAEAATPKPIPRPEPGEEPATAAERAPTSSGGGTETPAGSSIEELYADIPTSEFPIEITLDQGKAFWDRGGLLVLDAREGDEYEEGHIRGAELAPMDLVVGDLEWLDRMAAPEPRPIMVYCGGGDCELSLDLGFAINETGHRRVLILTDGYHAWEEAGYPVVKGESE